LRRPKGESHVLGTAGHIDHGKTALIRALTGVDTDRLPEERERGISIALGYARLELPSGRVLSVVDVPGHERFVRTMVAGATGIDLYLLVIAADDGVMPQTREHLRVLEALGVDNGVVAVTKCDLADPPELPFDTVIPVSAKTGEGLDDLRHALDAACVSADPCDHTDQRACTLHVDRVFSIRGAGTVVTGTLWSGRVAKGDTVTLLPSGRTARVRAVQVHDEAVDAADAGQRVALNLVGIDRDEVRRGDVVTTGGPEPRYVVEARLDHEPPARVMVHHGTRETAARATRRDDHWRLRCEQPLIVSDGDRLVVRRIAPPDTLGGGTVLPAPSPSLPVAEEKPRVAPPQDDTVRIGRERWDKDRVDEVRAKVVALLEDGPKTLAEIRDELGLGRKDTQALLERFDGEGLTLRRGEARVLRRRRREAP
jgi:selenocysteine-specific elongation factor